MVTFALKLSHNEQRVVTFLWARRHNASQIHSVMHPVDCDNFGKCFTKPAIQVWCKKMLVGQKFASDTEVQSVFRQWLGRSSSFQHHSLHRAKSPPF